MDAPPTRCIECGGFVDSLNEDEEGTPCPACAERLLETLPGVFHRPWMEPWAPREDAELDDEFADVLEDERDEAPPSRGDDEDSLRGPDRPA